MPVAHWLSVSSGLLVATLLACSSSKTGGGKMNAGGGSTASDGDGDGDGDIIEPAGRGGSSSIGTAGNLGRAGSSGLAGSTSSGGLTGTGGGCTGTPSTCVDADTEQYCDPQTGELQTLACSELVAEGFLTSGCTASLDGEGCAIDGVADEACADGASVFGVCDQLTGLQQVNVYVNCFQDNAGAHEIVTCLADYLDATTMMIDCAGAAICLPMATPPVPPAP